MCGHGIGDSDVGTFIAALTVDDYEGAQFADAAVRRGLEAAAPAIARAAVATALERLAACYPADVFPPDSPSRDAASGTALRLVLTAQAAMYRGEEHP